MHRRGRINVFGIIRKRTEKRTKQNDVVSVHRRQPGRGCSLINHSWTSWFTGMGHQSEQQGIRKRRSAYASYIVRHPHISTRIHHPHTYAGEEDD